MEIDEDRATAYTQPPTFVGCGQRLGSRPNLHVPHCFAVVGEDLYRAHGPRLVDLY